MNTTTTTADRRTRRVMSQPETIAMHKLLEQHVVCDFTLPIEQRQVYYREDWSDERVAKAISPDLNGQHAANLRKNLFGPLKEAKVVEIEDRVAALEEQYAQLNALVRELCVKHDDLVASLASILNSGAVDQLSVNRTAAARQAALAL